MILRTLVSALVVTQLIAAVRVVARMITTSRGVRIVTTAEHESNESVSVLLPVLNEETRLSPCLEGVIAQDRHVLEILVIDGGSIDGTRSVVASFALRDPRIRWVDASPVPADWNGKAWGLQRGLDAAAPDSDWILTIDADVRVGSNLVTSLLAHADVQGLDAFSVATPQRLSGAAEAIVHPSLLTTIVYRYGIPGVATTNPEALQANGQCSLARRSALNAIGGFGVGKGALSEDVTVARALARNGVAVGFFEPADREHLVRVEMYDGAMDAWRNWTRSLPMRDAKSGRSWWMRMMELTLTMGLPIPVLVVLFATDLSSGFSVPLRTLNLGLLIMRYGTAFGMRRAYKHVPRSYWLSPLLDSLVVFKLWRMALTRDHVWRGRRIRRN